MSQRRPLLDPDHPMFSRPWVRIVTTAVPLLWAGVEFWQGDPFWGLLFGAAGVYAGYKLFIYKP